MKRLVLLFLVAAGCHAHQVAQDRRSMASAPEPTPVKQKEVVSTRPVRTTPAGFLDEKSMRKIQQALSEKGVAVRTSGKLDASTQHAIKTFQEQQKQPATGLPDFGTLKLLGLSPEEIYLGGAKRQGNPQ